MKETVKNWLSDKKEALYGLDRKAALRKFGAGVMLVAAGFGIGRMSGGFGETDSLAPTAASVEATTEVSAQQENSPTIEPAEPSASPSAENERAENPMQLSTEEWKEATDIARQNIMMKIDEIRQQDPYRDSERAGYFTEESMILGDDPQVDKCNGEHALTSGKRSLDGGAEITVYHDDNTSSDNIEKSTTLTLHVKDGSILDDGEISYEELTSALQDEDTTLVEARTSKGKKFYDQDGNFLGFEEVGDGSQSVKIDENGNLKHVKHDNKTTTANKEDQARAALMEIINIK